jgi:uncharacterized protein YcbK (DUF882 family)
VEDEGLKKLFVLFLLLFAVSACAGWNSSSSSSRAQQKQLGQSGGIKTRPDPLAERRIVMTRAHTNEKFEGVYYRKGAYVAASMKSIERLMRDYRTDKVGYIDPELIDFMLDIRTRLGLPPTVVFEILSGYRSPESNAALARTNKNVARESLHMHGWAVDFRISAVKGSAIAEIAKTMQRGGVSFYPSDNHVHVDIGNIRTWGKGPSLPPPKPLTD